MVLTGAHLARGGGTPCSHPYEYLGSLGTSWAVITLGAVKQEGPDQPAPEILTSSPRQRWGRTPAHQACFCPFSSSYSSCECLLSIYLVPDNILHLPAMQALSPFYR